MAAAAAEGRPGEVVSPGEGRSEAALITREEDRLAEAVIMPGRAGVFRPARCRRPVSLRGRCITTAQPAGAARVTQVRPDSAIRPITATAGSLAGTGRLLITPSPTVGPGLGLIGQTAVVPRDSTPTGASSPGTARTGGRAGI